MKSNVRKNIKNENGAVTLLVVITVLTFIAILLGAYLTIMTLQKSQLESNKRIQQIYGKDVENVNEIYNQLIAKDSQKPSCEVSYELLGDNDITYSFRFTEDIKNFIQDDIKVYNASTLQTTLSNNLQISTSNPTYATKLENEKTYVISFDYKCISDTQKFELGLYSETNSQLPTKQLTATSQLQHENYKITVIDQDVQFKVLAQIENSNNITLSNFEIIEMQDTQETKEYFTTINNKEYTLMCDYDSTKRYVIIIEENSYEDYNGNTNDELIKVI